MTTKNTTLFISDLHLDPTEPKIANTFFYFLEHIAPDADALYILGDFFESYIGDDDHDPFIETMIIALSHLTQNGLPVFFLPGNRDFLIGKEFAKRAGITLIVDPTVITLYGEKILLLHGDSLCTADRSHQRFRKIVNNKLVQLLFLSLPLSYRKKIANKLRGNSQQGNRYKSPEIMDVSPGVVDETLARYHVKKMIHGHTHHSLISEKRIVLDAWHEHGNYLCVGIDGSVRLIEIAH